METGLGSREMGAKGEKIGGIAEEETAEEETEVSQGR